MQAGQLGRPGRQPCHTAQTTADGALPLSQTKRLKPQLRCHGPLAAVATSHLARPQLVWHAQKLLWILKARHEAACNQRLLAGRMRRWAWAPAGGDRAGAGASSHACCKCSCLPHTQQAPTMPQDRLEQTDCPAPTSQWLHMQSARPGTCAAARLPRPWPPAAAACAAQIVGTGQWEQGQEQWEQG